MAERDHELEMRELILARTASGTWTSRGVARDVVEQLRSTDPEFLHEWLDRRAENCVWQTVNDITRSQRAHARQTRGRREIADAIAAHEAGDGQAMRSWLDTAYVVNPQRERKNLGDMRRPDLLYVASGYRQTARRAQMHAAFFEALANKVGDKTVREVYDDQQIDTMYHSLGLEPA